MRREIWLTKCSPRNGIVRNEVVIEQWCWYLSFTDEEKKKACIQHYTWLSSNLLQISPYLRFGLMLQGLLFSFVSFYFSHSLYLGLSSCWAWDLFGLSLPQIVHGWQQLRWGSEYSSLPDIEQMAAVAFDRHFENWYLITFIISSLSVYSQLLSIRFSLFLSLSLTQPLFFSCYPGHFHTDDRLTSSL